MSACQGYVGHRGPREPWEESSALPTLGLLPSSSGGGITPCPQGRHFLPRVGEMGTMETGAATNTSKIWRELRAEPCMGCSVGGAVPVQRSAYKGGRTSRARGHSGSLGQFQKGKEAAGLQPRVCSSGWNRCRAAEGLCWVSGMAAGSSPGACPHHQDHFAHCPESPAQQLSSAPFLQ